MFACVDTHYFKDCAIAACITFGSWNTSFPVKEYRARITPIEPYIPGQFYRRELPCLLAVLKQVEFPLAVIVIDGYVWLGDDNHPGLGAYLHDALEGRAAVIGVAKNRFRGATTATKILRGKSRKPLYITTAGIKQKIASKHIQEMHGVFRIPSLLRQVDQLSRRPLRD